MVVFGAFAGAVFYVATATNIGRSGWSLIFYYIIYCGKYAGPIGNKLRAITHMKPLDAIWRSNYFCNVYKATFLNSQDLEQPVQYSFSHQEWGSNGSTTLCSSECRNLWVIK